MIRVAVVGTGAIAGLSHLPALRAQAHRTEVVAAVDVDAERVGAFCAEHGIPAAYTDVDEMLAAERPDLVHICTPPFTHAGLITACLAAGAWVWCEKPLCLSLAEHDLIAKGEGDAGPYASVVFQHRFGSGARHLRELAAAGRLGRPLVALCDTTWYRGHGYFDVPWRGRWDTEGGGPTMGHGIHQFDLMLSVLGDWREIQAMAATLDRRIEVEDVSMANVRFENGAMASVVNSVLSPREESYLRFDFAEATVELRHLYAYRNADWTCTPAASWAPPDDVGGSHAVQLAELLDCFEAGRRPPLSAVESRATMEFVTGLYASAFTGLAVSRAELTPDNRFYHRLNGEVAS